ncbi:MAG TPA: VWA domain-containing protein [Ornithinibacter sp.]|nr:VWA domain-containing protein [Ornithinibacter sp.]
MTFLSPWWLLLLLPVIALLGAYVLAQRRRRRYAVRFAALPMLDSVAPDRPGWRRHAPAAAFVLALSTLAVATARPEMDIRVPHERATVIVAIDVSRSMEATDVAPNRLDAARAAAATFVEGLPDSFNVGVVTFSGTTAVLSEPTTDHAAVVARLQGLSLADSTAIGEAVFTSLDQVAAMAARDDDADAVAGGGSAGGDDSTEGEAVEVPARIVLLSDGSNTRGREPAEAATAAAEAGVPVSTIAYGTASGVIEAQGRSIPVPVDEESLAALADATGGRAYTAASGDQLTAVYEDIGSSIGWRTEARELTPYLAALALLLMTVGGAMSLRWFARLP